MENKKSINNKIKKLEKKEYKLEKKEKLLDKKLKTIKEYAKIQNIKTRTKQSTIKFKNELKKSTNTAIVAAFAFVIALAWRDVITEYAEKLTQLTPIQGKLITAIIVTIVCVIGILTITKFLADAPSK